MSTDMRHLDGPRINVVIDAGQGPVCCSVIVGPDFADADAAVTLANAGGVKAHLIGDCPEAKP